MKKHVNATHYENIPTFPKGADRKSNVVHVIVETVQGSSHKNALENEYGIIALNQVLAEGLRWPYDYGFVPQTLADDGDPLDLLFLIDRPTFPGCLAKARILGSVKLKKNGVENDRIIGAPLRLHGSPQSTDAYDTLDDIPQEKLNAICKFLTEYSQDEGNTIELLGRVGVDEALKSLRAAMKQFKKKY